MSDFTDEGLQLLADLLGVNPNVTTVTETQPFRALVVHTLELRKGIRELVERAPYAMRQDMLKLLGEDRRSGDPVIPHPFVGRLTCENWTGTWPPKVGMSFRSECGWTREYHIEEGAVNNRSGAVGQVKTVDGEHTATCADEDCIWTWTTTKDGEAAHKLMEHDHVYPGEPSVLAELQDELKADGLWDKETE